MHDASRNFVLFHLCNSHCNIKQYVWNGIFRWIQCMILYGGLEVCQKEHTRVWTFSMSLFFKMFQPTTAQYLSRVFWMFYFFGCVLISALQAFRSSARKFSITLCWKLCVATYSTYAFTLITTHTRSHCCYCETNANKQHWRIKMLSYCYNSQTSEFSSLPIDWN
jgi:hypothetical protein